MLPACCFLLAAAEVFFGKGLVNKHPIEYNGRNYPINYGIEEPILMNKKRVIILCVLIFLLVAAIATGVVLKIQHDREEAEALRIYHETYLIMDGTEYLRASTELDLSGQQITELEKLKELTALKKLNLRGTGISAEQYEMLHAALPACEILWSVPFQGGYCDDTIQELTVETLNENDIAVLKYFPALVSVNADLCRGYDAIFALKQQRPDLAVTYTVTIGEATYPHTQDQLTITDPDADELMTQLPLLPHLENVTLEGTLPANEALIALKEGFPNITFLWNFSVCGVQTNTLADFLDLSNIYMADTSELEAALPCFYQLSKVDMISCGLKDTDMEALNNRHPETSFVWKVTVSGVYVRTDIKHFMPYKYNIKKVGNLYNLRYCTEVEVLDFGHRLVNDIAYIEYMPNLRYLLLLECNPDPEIIGNCTSLEYLEICSTPIIDFWPITNLTNLKDLNVSFTPMNLRTTKFGKFGDYTPLTQMTWLDRLWMANSALNKDQRAFMRDTLPGTELCFISTGSTDRGWRYSPRYYEQRDILGMHYMIG